MATRRNRGAKVKYGELKVGDQCEDIDLIYWLFDWKESS